MADLEMTTTGLRNTQIVSSFDNALIAATSNHKYIVVADYCPDKLSWWIVGLFCAFPGMKRTGIWFWNESPAGTHLGFVCLNLEMFSDSSFIF